MANSIEILQKSQKRITILGAGGFVGSHLREYLTPHFPKIYTPSKGDETIYSQDLGHVFYCAGLTADYAKRPFDTIEAHTNLLAQILKRAQFTSLVYLSSTRLYDSGSGAGKEDQDLILNPSNPRHSYDLSKALGEWLCLHASDGRARVARLASVYSHNLADRNFLHTTLETVLKGQNFTLDTAPDLARDYVYINDVCAALVAIAASGKQPIYNVASGHNVSNRELFAQIQKITGITITASKPPQKQQPPQINVSHLIQDFGLKPAMLADKLAHLLESNGYRQTGDVKPKYGNR